MIGPLFCMYISKVLSTNYRTYYIFTKVALGLNWYRCPTSVTHEEVHNRNNVTIKVQIAIFLVDFLIVEGNLLPLICPSDMFTLQSNTHCSALCIFYEIMEYTCIRYSIASKVAFVFANLSAFCAHFSSYIFYHISYCSCYATLSLRSKKLLTWICCSHSLLIHFGL